MASQRISALLGRVAQASPLPGPELVVDSGCFEQLGTLTQELGKRPVLLVGQGAYPQVAPIVERALHEANATFVKRVHAGYCSTRAVEAHVAALAPERPDLLIAIGGGRVLDTGKLVAQALEVPVVCLPTSAATCAAATNVAVPYSDTGICHGGVTLERMPDLVLLDLEVLRRAPRRLLTAGMVDAKAKCHEVRLAASSEEPPPALRAALEVCRELQDILAASSTAALQAHTEGQRSQALDEVLEAIIVLPGLASAFAGPANRVAIAHLVHNLATHYAHDPRMLHGELVGCGVLCQLGFEGLTESYAAEVAWYRQLELRFAPSQLGFVSADLRHLAADVAESPVARRYFPGLTLEDVLATLGAIEKTVPVHECTAKDATGLS